LISELIKVQLFLATIKPQWSSFMDVGSPYECAIGTTYNVGPLFNAYQ